MSTRRRLASLPLRTGLGNAVPELRMPPKRSAQRTLANQGTLANTWSGCAVLGLRTHQK